MARRNGVRNNLMIGAAVAGLIGTLTTLLLPRRSVRRGWTDQAKELAQQMMHVNAWAYPKFMNKNIVMGGVAGGLVGVATALLLAPKSGSELIRDISDVLHLDGEEHEHHPRHARHARHATHRQSVRTTVKRKAKKAASAVSHAVSHPKAALKKAIGKKKAKTKRPSRKKSVASAAKEVSSTAEKAAV